MWSLPFKVHTFFIIEEYGHKQPPNESAIELSMKKPGIKTMVGPEVLAQASEANIFNLWPRYGLVY